MVVPTYLTELVGQDRAVRTLSSYVASGRTSGSLLLEGPEGSGRRTAARLFAADLLGDPRPLRGSHPDCVEWDCTEGSLAGLPELAGKVPFEARCMVVVLHGADRLSEAAANALLKTLEQPGDRLTLVLTSTSGVMDTVQSRCLRVAFRMLSLDEKIAILTGRGKDCPRERALFSATLREALAGGWEQRREALRLARDRLVLVRTASDSDFAQLVGSVAHEEVSVLIDAALALDGRSEVIALAMDAAAMLRDKVRPENVALFLLFSLRGVR